MSLKSLIQIIAVAAFGLSACAPQVAKVNERFSAAEASFIHERGSARLEGQAFLRQRAGGIVTAAGSDVWLIPVTRYSRARIDTIYGNAKIARRGVDIESTPSEYYSLQRKTKADASGRFAFENLKSGNYFVVTSVLWQRPSGSILVWEGGNIYESVSLSPGQHKSIVMNGQ